MMTHAIISQNRRVLLRVSETNKVPISRHIHYTGRLHDIQTALKPGFSQQKICRSLPLSFSPILMEDARQCAESNEKSIFRFLFFELYIAT